MELKVYTGMDPPEEISEYSDFIYIIYFKLAIAKKFNEFRKFLENLL